jgi:hypothetical protein
MKKIHQTTVLSAFLFVMSLLISDTAVAQNKIYMEQVGDNSTIEILQDGDGNSIGTELTPVYIGSGSNTVIIEQIGMGNQLALLVNGAATDVTVNQLGSNNTADITCGGAATASCSGSRIELNVSGDTNQVTNSFTPGANHEVITDITGDQNVVNHVSTNAGTVNSTVTVVGNMNNIGVTQSGTVAKVVQVLSTGDSNNITIVQTD